ncbi:MAG: tyrosine-type recombinase/integrase [Acidimicrobiales bacterium]
MRLGFGHRRPFILGEDGGYDYRLNAFFGACPTFGVRSAASQRAYAYDLLAFARFLAGSGKTVWDADRHDIDRYFGHRCGENAAEPLSLRSWNRAVTALKTFYLWAREDGHVAEVPFRRKTVWTLPSGGGGRRPVEVLAGTVRAGQSPRRIRFLTRDQYVAFRTVGLLGRLPDGSEDPAWTGRNGARDAAFADLLVHSGARVAEAASLLVPELPQPSGDTVTLRLAAPTTKGAKGREVVFATGVLRSIIDYVGLERANVVRRTIDKPLPDDALLVRRSVEGVARKVEVFHDGLWSKASVANLPTSMRSGLFEVDADERPVGPLGLWLNERGTVMAADAWRGVFERASARCRRHGLDLDVTPHVLRHTFAVHMLHHLVQAEGIVHPRGDERSFRSMVVNPVRTLQRLLGHAHIMTTYTYLECVADLGWSRARPASCTGASAGPTRCDARRHRHRRRPGGADRILSRRPGLPLCGLGVPGRLARQGGRGVRLPGAVAGPVPGLRAPVRPRRRGAVARHREADRQGPAPPGPGGRRAGRRPGGIAATARPHHRRPQGARGPAPRAQPRRPPRLGHEPQRCPPAGRRRR